ncbi:MAG: flagellar protein FliO/FliZ [Gammaproteobacteria bacterium]|nr:MAG: flagellar protein FliO/FliZ [Gammaproteobacteria bacterium]TND06736.1 MAG: flagellar protein FliO/FliZ [Gammaproteobacteria bacterium]
MRSRLSSGAVQGPWSGLRRLTPVARRVFVSIAALVPPAWAAGAETASTAANVAPFDTGNVLRIVIGLMVVVIAIVATAWGLRRWGNFRASAQGELQIIGGLSMGPRERLVLVRVGDEQLLLGVAPGRIQTLHKLERPVPVNSETARGESFAERMRTAVKQRAGL